jgi:hypothetical protein
VDECEQGLGMAKDVKGFVVVEPPPLASISLNWVTLDGNDSTGSRGPVVTARKGGRVGMA